MNKYGVLDVFDLFIYDKDGLVFKIDTVKDMVIERREDNPNNILFVQDALVDTDLMNKVLAGDFDGENLRIVGKSSFRDADSFRDRDVELNITIAQIFKYSIPFSAENASVVDLEFQFPVRDAYGFLNANLNIKDEK